MKKAAKVIGLHWQLLSVLQRCPVTSSYWISIRLPNSLSRWIRNTETIVRGERVEQIGYGSHIGIVGPLVGELYCWWVPFLHSFTMNLGYIENKQTLFFVQSLYRSQFYYWYFRWLPPPFFLVDTRKFEWGYSMKRTFKLKYVLLPVLSCDKYRLNNFV